jgi:hypothetical protein
MSRSVRSPPTNPSRIYRNRSRGIPLTDHPIAFFEATNGMGASSFFFRLSYADRKANAGHGLDQRFTNFGTSLKGCATATCHSRLAREVTRRAGDTQINAAIERLVRSHLHVVLSVHAFLKMLRGPSDQSSLTEYVCPFDRTTHRPNLHPGDFDPTEAAHLLHDILAKLNRMNLFDVGRAEHAPLRLLSRASQTRSSLFGQ